MNQLLICRLLVYFVVVVGLFESAQAQDTTANSNAEVSKLPTIVELVQQMNTLVSAGDLVAADMLINQAIKDMRNRVEPLIMQARLALLQRNTAKAFSSLERAVDLGFADLGKLLEDPAFTEMQIAQGIGELLERSAAVPRFSSNPTPAIRQGNTVNISTKNLVWDANAKRFIALIDLKPNDNNAPMTSPDATGADIAYLRTLSNACGLKGVLYDNRDRTHSNFSYNLFPQITHTVYDKQLQANSFDYALGNKLTYTAITFGNSSTRYSLPNGGSLPRRSMMWHNETGRAYQNYTSDHIYVYPAGRDDYPANWAYNFSSKGNSRSDKWILRDIALILAALPCDTRNRLDAENLIAPTVQMIFRHGQLHVQSRETYLSGAAHPVLFPESVNAPKRMMDIAASMRPEDIPPMVQMKIIEEGFSETAGLAGLSEKLVTTPSAIARVWRGWSGRQVLKLTASNTVDPNGRDLTFDWRILRGDPKQVKIEANGPDATITINWQNKTILSPGDNPRNIRVDIGVFANNGVYDSTPGFISIHFPTHQKRRYIRGVNGAPQLVSIDYDAVKYNRLFDPVLYWSAPWEDQFGYDAKGNLAGWVRKSATSRTLFTANGQLPNGQKPAYTIQRNSNKPPVLKVH